VSDDLALEPAPAVAPKRDRGGASRSTRRFFSIATGLSRIVGLVREVVASSYSATRGRSRPSRSLPGAEPGALPVADAALSSAFVPVFTELLEQKKRREAFRLASTLFFVILAGLGAITALFILGAAW